MIGKVKWFNNVKGFGFIVSEDEKEVFIHYTELNTSGYKTIDTDVKVEFDIVETDKGYQAKNVKIIDEE